MPLTTIYGDGTRIVGDANALEQTLHPTVMAYINIMQSTTGGNYAMSVNEIDAVNNMVQALVANGIWNKMQVIYPFIGNSANAMKFNLKDASTTNTFNITFNGTDFTFSTANGLRKTLATNGSWGNTNYIPNTHQTTNDTHMSVYMGTTQAGTSIPLGCLQEPAIAWFLVGSANTPPLQAYYTIQSPGTATQYSYPGGINTGFLLGTRSANNNKIFFNGILGATSTTSGTNKPNLAATIGVYNATTQGRIFPCTQALRIITIGAGLSDAEAKAFSTIVQAYQTKLGRQV
jgi:hypothetical protein